jgi:1-phosphatidylinositol phosphodiesterase
MQGCPCTDAGLVRRSPLVRRNKSPTGDCHRYNIPSFLSIPEKAQLATEFLLPPTATVTQPVLSVTYLSASSFPLATPPVISTGFGWPQVSMGVEGVNSRVARFLITSLKANTMLRAWTLVDFYDQPVGTDLVPLLVECNFKGRTGDAQTLERD